MQTSFSKKKKNFLLIFPNSHLGGDYDELKTPPPLPETK
jgi:hypothetical protein